MKSLINFFLLLLPIGIYSQDYNKEVLEEIKEKSINTNSDGVIIYRNDSIVYKYLEKDQEKPIYIASAGKSLVSMAIGKLLQDGLLDSLDQPLFTLFPEWKQGQKKFVTVKMLLNHTSGLQDFPNASLELEPAPDYKNENIINLALAAELQSPPGQNIFYSNKATALLGGVIEKASGKRLDKYFEEEFFEPLNITDYEWIRDKAGNPTAHGAFLLKPSDLLKFGVVMLHEGFYNGKKILNKTWIEESVKSGQSLDPIWGLLWWRIPETATYIIDEEIIEEWRKEGVSENFIAKIEPIMKNRYSSRDSLYDGLSKILNKDGKKELQQLLPHYVRWYKRIFSGELKGYYAQGYRGNFLIIVPEKKLVALRVADHEGFGYGKDTFNEFVDLVMQL